ncbi:competence protein ComK [Virgibacillus ndiopensis]|uniref:competence protein ComK n=1 Tax=Virgibacillus ndiopensis TaxID=2004408 RepID=UPI001FE4098A|nr:competence protein ComK [Virgibacillus ndiopensis]
MKDFYSPSYEITPLTLAIIAKPDENGNFSTCIFEDQEEVLVEHIPTKIIDNACKFFGASLKGS